MAILLLLLLLRLATHNYTTDTYRNQQHDIGINSSSSSSLREIVYYELDVHLLRTYINSYEHKCRRPLRSIRVKA